jgi:hypothetical protein
MLPLVAERIDEFQPRDILTIIIAAKNVQIDRLEVKRELISLGLESIKKIVAVPDFMSNKELGLIAHETIKAVKHFVYKESQKQ